MVIKPTTYDAYKLMHESILAFARAERQGIRVDLDYCTRKKKFLTRKIDKLTKDVESSDFYKRWKHIYGQKASITSNHQLSHMVYKVLKLKPPKLTDSGMGATDEESLDKLDVPELKGILEIRGLKKLRDTYLDAFIREQVDGYIHPFFNTHTVITYRTSSDSPNFQNMPKRNKNSMKIIRQALLPRPGHMFLEADFSSLEVNISACYHRDPTMMRYLLDPKSDMHLDVAKDAFLMDHMDKSVSSHNTLRQAGKNGFVFPEFYGSYYVNCAEGMCEWAKLPMTRWKKGMGIVLDEATGETIGDHLISKGISSYKDFVEHIRKVEDIFWNERFPVYTSWKEQWYKEYQKNGYFKMFTGFTCSGLMSRNEVINYPVQGAASHCLDWSFVQMDRFIRENNLDTRLIGQIHDAMLLDVHPDELELVKATLHRITSVDLPKAWDWIIVPLKIEIDEYPVDGSWASSH